MKTILLLLSFGNHDFQFFQPSEAVKLCLVQKEAAKPSKAFRLHPDGSKTPLTCELVPEKKIVTIEKAYWTAY